VLLIMADDLRDFGVPVHADLERAAAAPFEDRQRRFGSASRCRLVITIEPACQSELAIKREGADHGRRPITLGAQAFCE
jgi:hypothetical protein